MKTWKWVVGGLVATGIVLPLIAGLGGDGKSGQKTEAIKNATPADAEKQLAEMRYYQGVILAKTIKNSLKNPSSMQLERVSVNEDGSLVCMAYRAQNGFGGMDLAPAVMIRGKISNDGNVWDKNCKGKSMYNLKEEVEIALAGSR
ncbi:hypothetical protein ICN48_00720 [Polynucleobacter sp. JS-Safj-400b-B2]|uniref:hypothetical protein n=1 Tax=Polynucleobacter sp. JS-Safj-400b-B2 TaxID=2576921 RepID=UPI001C0D5BF3|nr:hypothetical protein [Polynucleobacter sp. JS-Safj-400b-B2]MBU3624763.1 hypothetical protein [Polynucleobacter sp. JS-Safj-400b-B2]